MDRGESADPPARWREDSDGKCSFGSPTLCTQDIFEQLIEEEVSAGRLTKSRRKRIVRYAAQLRLSAVDAGMMIEQARRRAAMAQPHDDHPHGLRFCLPSARSEGPVWKIWGAVILAIGVDAAFLCWIW